MYIIVNSRNNNFYGDLALFFDEEHYTFVEAKHKQKLNFVEILPQQIL